ncbi:hypothetical protein [Nocardioides sp. GXZ039]|uniref:hypothetical protein n=1 Tax=Nocardioides sp. GXZ039 TaxID=3136018 RepID=UPI0030F3FE18
MAFDLGEFYSLCSKIEYKLGILRGNELVREWWQAWQVELGNTPRYGYLTYVSTPAEWEYMVQFLYHGMPSADGADYDDAIANERAAHAQVDAAAAEVWANGRAWASSLSEYLNQICASLIRPDKDSLTELTEELKSLRDNLNRSVPPNWAEGGLDLADWVGGSSDAFGSFATQLHDQVQTYADYVKHAIAWWASACALVLETQTGLNSFLKEVDDNLHKQLVAWAETQGNPQSTTGEINPLVADIVKLGDEIIDFIPVVSDVRDKAVDAIEAADAALNLFGVDVELTLPAKFTVQTAEEIWTGLTTTLHEDYRVKCDEKLADMAEQSTAAVADIDGLGESFYPVKVGDGARAPEWTHPLES